MSESEDGTERPLPPLPMRRARVPGAPLVIGGVSVEQGERRAIALEISERYTGQPVILPLHVVRAPEPGPAVFVTACVHGDELNGTGILRSLILDGIELVRGTLIMAPVVNVFGLETRSRYLPDRRDLNRSFPGSPHGSLASRMANTILREVVMNADFGLDLHTAAVGRTNFPHVRANLLVPELVPLAEAFGCEVIYNTRPHAATLRAAATRSGCPTLLLEAGEALKIEPGAVRIGARGIKNVLRYLGMLEGKIVRPTYQTRANRSTWVRAPIGGLLRFHVEPGGVVDKRQPIVTIDNLIAQKSQVVRAPVSGIVLGLPTMPAVKPGDPVAHIAVPSMSCDDIRQLLEETRDSLHRQVQEHIATDLTVVPFKPPPKPKKKKPKPDAT